MEALALNSDDIQATVRNMVSFIKCRSIRIMLLTEMPSVSSAVAWQVTWVFENPVRFHLLGTGRSNPQSSQRIVMDGPAVSIPSATEGWAHSYALQSPQAVAASASGQFAQEHAELSENAVSGHQVTAHHRAINAWWSVS